MPESAPSGRAEIADPARAVVPRWLRPLAFALGVLLLAAAAYMLWAHADELCQSWRAARSAPAWLVGAVLLLPLVNWAVTSLIFWALTRRFAAVGYREMCALIGSAWLLNMLPFKPGLVGRVAYHRAMSGISVADSLMVTATALLTGAVGVALTVCLHVACDPALRAIATGPMLFPIAVVAVGALLLVGLWLYLTRGQRHRILGGGAAVLIAVLLRIADTYVWSLRYFLAFRLIGQEQAFGACVVVAGVSQLAGQMPVQLGLREWSVGVTAAAMRSSGSEARAASVVPGLTADLVCRASEIVCALPLGLVSTWWVYRHIRRKRGG